MEAAFCAFDKKSEEEVNNILNQAVAGVASNEKGIVFEGVLELILCDSVIAKGEVERLFQIAESMGVEPDQAILMLLDMTNSEVHKQITAADVKKRLDAAADKVEEVLNMAEEYIDKETFSVER